MALISKLFRYKNGSIRFIWKFILLMLVTAIFTVLAAVPLNLIHLSVNEYIKFLLTEAMIILAVLFLNQVLDNGQPIGLRLNKGWLVSFGQGLISAICAVTVIFILELLFNQIAVVKINGQFLWLFIKGFVLFLSVGLAEEIMNRGFVVKSLLPGYGYRIAITMSALIFAGLHARNANFSWLAFFNTFLVGILLAYIYIKKGSLWWPIGFHTAWNLFVGVIYGLPVSGLIINPIIKTRLISPNIINGGKYGPEGGLLVTFLLVALLIIEWAKYREKGEQI